MLQSLQHIDPPTRQSELEVYRAMHLISIVNNLLDAFADTKSVTKSHIPAVNAHARMEMPNESGIENNTRESRISLKHGRPVSSKDMNPRKQKET